jgi:16S rRNA (adenine(1408)-N(1))-methyltransferase
MDLGTGDGRLPDRRARRCPKRLFIGVDANARGLREVSGRAIRDRVQNLLFVRSAVETLPPELTGSADRVTVVLPWGSLLAAVARPVLPVLRGIRRLCQPRASVTVVLALDPERDRAEHARIGLPLLDLAYLRGELADRYAMAGFVPFAVRRVSAEELAEWPSTWCKRLAHGRPRSVFQIEAIAR